MKAIAVNGSPRRQWNTARLLEKALEGTAAAGAETRLVHLYDLDFRGCTSCFACKLNGGKSYGRCAMRDGLTPLLDEIHDADALILGSPIYFLDATGEMRSFMERLCFQYGVYTDPFSSIFGRKMPTALVYTMNITEDGVAASGLGRVLTTMRGVMQTIFGTCDMMLCTNTLQFEEYSLYETALFDAAAKRERRQETFPQDLEKAFLLGKRLLER